MKHPIIDCKIQLEELAERSVDTEILEEYWEKIKFLKL